MSIENVLREMREWDERDYPTIGAWADVIEAVIAEKDAGHRAAMRTCMEWRRKDKAEIEILKGDNKVFSKEWWRLRDENGHLKEKNEQLREALNAMLTFYGMDEEKGELSEVIHNQARAAIAGKEDKA